MRAIGCHLYVMGRKIPGKKHRGVKDPLQQLARRNDSLSTKVNAPPLQPDDQGVPKSLLRLMKLKQDVKQGKYKHKKKKKRPKGTQWLIDTEALVDKDIKLPGMTKPDKPVPRLIQKPGESVYNFLHRMDRTCNEVIKEAQFERKFGVNVIRDTQTGDIIDVAKKPKDPVLEYDTLKKRKRSASIPGTNENMSKTARRKQKQLERKQSKDNNVEKDFGMFKDNVKFGEVASQPPRLKQSRRITKSPLEKKPGKKDLLLKSFLENENKESVSRSSVKLNLTAKKKKISAAEFQRQEQKRQAAVNAYRSVKSQKMNKQPSAVLR